MWIVVNPDTLYIKIIVFLSLAQFFCFIRVIICAVSLKVFASDCVRASFSLNVSVSDRDLGKGGTVEHTFDKHSIDLEPGNPVRADLASLLVGNRTEPV